MRQQAETVALVCVVFVLGVDGTAQDRRSAQPAPLAADQVALGTLLFFDPRLAGDGTNFSIKSPFFFKLPDDVFRGEVHVNFGCLDSVVAEQFLKGPEADATFQTADREGVAQDVGADWLSDAGPVGHNLDDALNLAGADSEGILHGVVVLDETSDTGRHRKNPNLRPLAERASFAPDSQAFLLPEYHRWSDSPARRPGHRYRAG